MSKKKITTETAYRLVFPFSEEGEGRFNVLWTAFCISFPKMAKGYEQLKMCNKIGAKLEAISEETPGQENAVVPDRKLNAQREMLLEPMERDKLKAMVKNDEIPWTHRIGPQVESTIEELEACIEVDAMLVEQQQRQEETDV